METTHLYRTRIRWNEQRKGTSLPEGLPALEVATPPEFPGGHPGIWSPEHLFVASVEACIMTTFLAIAANSKLEFTAYESEADGTLEKLESGYMITEITVRPVVTVPSEDLVPRARRIVEKAEQNCLISASMKTKVKLEPEVRVG
jgi:organic hydroperoxide reductase OsmC/OhrA